MPRFIGAFRCAYDAAFTPPEECPDESGHGRPEGPRHGDARMIRPTRRAVLLFAAVLPLPWLALSVRTSLWPYAFHPAIVFLLCLAADAVLARPRRRVTVALDTPDAAYIGDSLEAALTIRQDK